MNTNPQAFRILCYGDSYTWGYVPDTNHERFEANVRWTGVLQDILGREFEVIEEGLNSRTLKSDDLRVGKEGRNGSDYFIPCIDTHDPLDLVMILLGTNELKDKYSSSKEDIEKIIEKDFVQVALNRKSQFRDSCPKVLLVSPPLLNLSKNYARERYMNSGDLNNSLRHVYQKISEKSGCYFFDASEIVEVGKDGVHIDAKNHKKLGEYLAQFIKANII